MQVVVHKYGGTSMGSVDRIKRVAYRVHKWYQAGYQVVVVPSAMSGETNRLLSLAQAISTQPSPRELDQLLSTGEQASAALLSLALQSSGVEAISLSGWQVPIWTDSVHGRARIREIDTHKTKAALEATQVVIITGFQGLSPEQNITTLGRGGSDTSAVAIAAALDATECLIYTDVDGVYTTDPRMVPQASHLPRATFEEMLEMASLGSKILQIRSVEFAGKYRIPLRILSSLEHLDASPEEEQTYGTLITYEDQSMESPEVSAIAFSRDEAKLTLVGVADQPGVAYEILGTIAAANINVDIIVQNIGHAGLTDFSFTVPRADYLAAHQILLSIQEKLGVKAITGNDKIVKVSIVGVGMRSHAGIASKMFQVLAQQKINIQMIATSEIKISVVLDEAYLESAVKSLHTAFDLDTEPSQSTKA